MKTKNSAGESPILAKYQAELAALPPDLSLDIDAAAQAVSTALRAIADHDAAEAGYEGGRDVWRARRIELYAELDQANIELDGVRSRHQHAQRRARELRERLDADTEMNTTAAALRAIDHDVVEHLAERQRAQAAEAAIAAELTAAQEKAEREADEATEAALDARIRGEKMKPLPTRRDPEIESLTRQLSAARGRVQRATAAITDLQDQVPELLQRWRTARLNAARTALDDAMLTLQPCLADVIAAEREVGGLGDATVRLTVPEDAIAVARKALLTAMPSVKVVALEPERTDDADADGIDADAEAVADGDAPERVSQ